MLEKEMKYHFDYYIEVYNGWVQSDLKLCNVLENKIEEKYKENK